jgi:hypothetical protein
MIFLTILVWDYNDNFFYIVREIKKFNIDQ